ncbi:hypothetical protein JCM16303_004024 [Sporobolomyces ruberrimus]
MSTPINPIAATSMSETLSSPSQPLAQPASPDLSISATPVPIDVAYYQRELGFWRDETLRYRRQVEQLVRSSQPSSPSPHVSFSEPPVLADDPAEILLPREPTPSPQSSLTRGFPPSSFFAQIFSDPLLETRIYKILRMIAYFIVCILFAWRTLLEIPFFLLLPGVGFALYYFSSSVFRK